MQFKSDEFVDCVFDRIANRQKKHKNGCFKLELRAINKQHKSCFEKNIKSAKINTTDLPKLIAEQNLIGQILTLVVSIPKYQYIIKELWFIQKNLPTLKRVRIQEAFELDGINFKCDNKIILGVEGPHNITIKNSKFKRVELRCIQNHAVQILNTRFLDSGFCSDTCDSLFMENNRVISSTCEIYGCKNKCFVKNIFRKAGIKGIVIERCQNFLIQNACISDMQYYGISIHRSNGKIRDCIILDHGFRLEGISNGVLVQRESQIRYSNLKFENMDRDRIRVLDGSSFIQDD